MGAPHDAKVAKAYLETLCAQIDRKQPLRRTRKAWWVIAAPVGIALGALACSGSVEDDPKGNGKAEVCDDQADNDGDGKID